MYVCVCVCSNNCSMPHTLVSCSPVSLKDQLKVTVVGTQGTNTGRGRAESVNKEDIAVRDDATGTGGSCPVAVLPPGTHIEVQLELIPV